MDERKAATGAALDSRERLNAARDGVRMAKRSKGTKRTTPKGNGSEATPTNAMERRVLAFAEELGRIAGTVHARAEGWMDRETLNKQMARVRDGAESLLTHLGLRAKASKRKTASPARGRSKKRSGGVVDAPGKKHRKLMPGDPDANIADSQAAKTRAAKTMVKTYRRRGRG